MRVRKVVNCNLRYREDATDIRDTQGSMPDPPTQHRTHPAQCALSVLIGLICLFSASCADKAAAGRLAAKGMQAVPVTTTAVVRKDVPIEIQAIGNVEAYSTITVKAQVGGQLTSVYFHEGDFVKAGDLLFTIDQRPLEAQLQQMEANVARDTAQLGQAQANLARDVAQAQYAAAQAARYAKLFSEGIISKEQSDQYSTNADAVAQAVSADKAAIESARASMVASKAAVENARVQLSYTNIRSPLDGRTGNLNVKQGNVVAANSMDLMTINQVQPIYVTFAVPEAHLPDIKKYMAHGQLPVVAAPENAEAQERGTLTFVDNAVDPTTGTIKLKGTFPNPERRLWPGQFVRVTLRLTTQPNALTVPNQAVQTGQDGPFVYVVKQDRTVEVRPVVPGARVNEDLVIDKGLELGETVVTEGQLRLAPGSKVQMKDGRGGGRGRGGRPTT